MMAKFNNQAALTYNNQTTLSNIVTGNLVEIIAISKDAVNRDYAPGETVTYVVNLTNAGPASYTDLTVNDDMGLYFFGMRPLVPLDYVEGTVQLYVDGVRQDAPAVTAGPPMVITGINLPAGSNAQLIYQAEVNRYAPLGVPVTSITNRVRVTGNGLNDVIEARATIPMNVKPQLSIIKAIDHADVRPEEPVTYTFTVQNSGASEANAGENIVVSDRFMPALNITRVELNDEELTEGADYNYNRMAGLFTTNPGRITVPAATFIQDMQTGAYTTMPGTAILKVTGVI